MKRTWILTALGLALFACGTPPEQTPEEVCGNGVDDNDDGQADCSDPACAEAQACNTKTDECDAQADCMDGRTFHDLYWYDSPMPMCSEDACVTPEGPVEIRIDVDTQSYSPLVINSFNTRFVKKAAVDGSAVSCARLEDLFGLALTAPKGNEIEASGLFNLQAFDARSTSQPIPGGTPASIPNVDTAQGADFIIWMEMWSQRVDANTKLPKGKRYGWKCVESGDAVEPITAADHLVKQMKIDLDGPQTP